MERTDNSESEKPPEIWVREELLHLLSVSGTLAGLCVTVVALMHKIATTTLAATVLDDLFALCALLFLTCIYLIFWSLRMPRAGVTRVLVKMVDAIFLIGLTLMTAAGFMMVYTVW